MRELLDYLNKMTPERQRAFAQRCGTSVGYLRKAASMKQRLGAKLVIAVEKESNGTLRCEALRPDVDWAYLRQSCQCADINQAEQAA